MKKDIEKLELVIKLLRSVNFLTMTLVAEEKIELVLNQMKEKEREIEHDYMQMS